MCLNYRDQAQISGSEAPAVLFGGSPLVESDGSAGHSEAREHAGARTIYVQGYVKIRVRKTNQTQMSPNVQKLPL